VISLIFHSQFWSIAVFFISIVTIFARWGLSALTGQVQLVHSHHRGYHPQSSITTWSQGQWLSSSRWDQALSSTLILRDTLVQAQYLWCLTVEWCLMLLVCQQTGCFFCMYFSFLIHKGALHIWSTETRSLLIPAEELSRLWYGHGRAPSTNTQEFSPAQLQNSPCCFWEMLKSEVSWLLPQKAAECLKQGAEGHVATTGSGRLSLLGNEHWGIEPTITEKKKG